VRRSILAAACPCHRREHARILVSDKDVEVLRTLLTVPSHPTIRFTMLLRTELEQLMAELQMHNNTMAAAQPFVRCQHSSMYILGCRYQSLHLSVLTLCALRLHADCEDDPALLAWPCGTPAVRRTAALEGREHQGAPCYLAHPAACTWLCCPLCVEVVASRSLAHTGSLERALWTVQSAPHAAGQAE
jgi:hypothetical protein